MLASFLVIASILAIGAATASAAPPTVITETPTSTSPKSANFYGSVNPNGLPTKLYFQYGTTTAYGSAAPGFEIEAGEGSTMGKWWALNVPLSEDTVYHVRIVAWNKDGTSYGEDKAFKTLEPAAPTWKLQTTPAGIARMTDISCVTGGECFAVGGTGASKLAMRWNGTEWKYQTTAPGLPGPTSLDGVSCTSATSCIAVGYFTIGSSNYLLAEKWDGTSWKRLELGLASIMGKFTTVSCATVSYCIAVRENGGTMLWNGTEWKGGSGGVPFSDVSCPTTTFCMAVGGASSATWNGGAWTARTVPAGYELLGVSCKAVNLCTAVGFNTMTAAPVALRWDGTKWNTQSVPAPVGATSTLLFGVSCPRATVCFATGTYRDAGGVMRTVAERWDGFSWAIQTSPNPVGGTENGLYDVSCISAVICESIGGTRIAGNPVALAENAS
jgi:hypothetical protein